LTLADKLVNIKRSDNSTRRPIRRGVFMRRWLPALVFVLLSLPAAAQETFSNLQLTVQEGDKVKRIDITAEFTADALVVRNKETKEVRRTIPYDSIRTAEYSYAKSPRWKSAIFVSPLFLFTSGKQHWFMVTSASEQAVVKLDKSVYRLFLATFETRTGKKVETVADSK